MSKRDALIEKRTLMNESDDFQIKVPISEPIVSNKNIEHTRDGVDSIYSEDVPDESDKFESDIIYLPTNPLSNEIDSSILLSDMEINICLFRVNNTSCRIPFLQFAVIIRDNVKSFPSIANVFSEQNDNIHTEVMNACIETILELFPTMHDSYGVEIHQEMYKGFAVSKIGNTIYLIFEMYTMETHESIEWALIHDIMTHNNTKEWSPLVSNVFLENLEMTKLYEGSYVLPTPQMMYGMSRKDPNSLYQPMDVGACIIDNTYNHTIFGDYNYFSGIIDTNITAPQKYVVFITNERYILRDIKLCSKEAIDAFTLKYHGLDILAIYFHEGEQQLWCIKSPDLFSRI